MKKQFQISYSIDFVIEAETREEVDLLANDELVQQLDDGNYKRSIYEIRGE